MSLEQIAINYALAYDALKKARADLRKACSAMAKPYDPDNFEPGNRRFDSPRQSECNEGSEDGMWYYAGTTKPVDDPADLAIIDRWAEAHAAKVSASRRLGAHKAAFLRAGRKLASEALTGSAS